MGRKIAILLAAAIVAIVSVSLMGGEPGSGILWWGTHEPIYIFGDNAFTYENGVISGSGTASDPYVIGGWQVNCAGADYGITIDHTTRYFVIKQCNIVGAKAAGITFNTVENGRIEGCVMTGGETGVRFLNARNNTLTTSVIAQNHYGVVMSIDSRYNTVFGNSLTGNAIDGLDPGYDNRWYQGTTGNYYSDYSGVDSNGDGVGDRAFAPLHDLYPLMKPPVPWTHLAPGGTVLSNLPRSPQGMFVVTSQTAIALESTDPGSGVAKTLYSINNGAWQTYTTPIQLSGPDGVYKVAYYAIDNLGNVEPVTTLSFVLDDHPPATAISFGDPNYVNATGQWITSKTQVTLSLTSASTYGQTRTYFAIDGGAWRCYSGPFTVGGPNGPHLIRYYSQNASGNTEAVQQMTVYVDNAAPTTRGGTPAEGPSMSPPPSPAPSAPSSEAVPPAAAQTTSEAPLAVTSTPAPTPATQTPESTLQTQSEETGS